ncbi:flagellar hook-basal body complex protein FliE [Bacillus spongiae]|uniref:Flagellar hook-basal body complex protein FliE n=1 Tax=Bacillus spongiae TaxID=2683610 RepID=A0ABU8HAI1_9BACI
MAFSNIDSINQIILSPSSEKKIKTTPNEAHTNFAEFLTQSLNEVNELEMKSHELTEKVVKGEEVDLHQVMIAAQKASISLQTTVEIRNKVVESYKEIMRMQM